MLMQLFGGLANIFIDADAAGIVWLQSTTTKQLPSSHCSPLCTTQQSNTLFSGCRSLTEVEIGPQFAKNQVAPVIQGKPRHTDSVTQHIQLLCLIADKAACKCSRQNSQQLRLAGVGRMPWVADKLMLRQHVNAAHRIASCSGLQVLAACPE
jgi:hypothetical protein